MKILLSIKKRMLLYCSDMGDLRFFRSCKIKFTYKCSSFLNIILYYSGYFNFSLNKKINSSKGVDLIVLTYHSIVLDEIRHAGLEVSSKNFSKQMRFLQRYFEVVSISDGLNSLESTNGFKNKVIVTFDDGYRDNYKIAFPVLQKYNIPAAVFLTTNPIVNNGLLWGNELDLAVSQTNLDSLKIDGFDVLELSTDEMKIKATRILKKHIKSLASDEKDFFLNKIYDLLNFNNKVNVKNWYEMLSIHDLKMMSKYNITFGSHTCTHPIVSKISNNEFRYELIESRKKILEWTGDNVKFFAYPNGQLGDFTENSKSILKELNFKAAFTMVRGTNNPLTDKYELKRLPIKDCSLPDFVGFILKYMG